VSAPPRRTALSHVGGPTSQGGDPRLAEVLARALAAAEGARDDALTHGFHVYPARMHPAIAAEVLAELVQAGDRVLDPFCGSGTVLLEARLRGAIATGVDLNPVAMRVAEVRLDRRSHSAIDRFVANAERVVAASLARVKERAPSRAPLPPREVQYWASHVLRELGGLHAEIQAVQPPEDRRALEVVLSAIVVKFSRQRADTSAHEVERRVGKGIPSRFFASKAAELAERWRALADALPADAPPAALVLGDARELTQLVGYRGPFDLVLSSPPYGGTYDYVDHHSRRYAWLGVSPRAMAEGELGARRRYASGGKEAPGRWDEEVGHMLQAMRAVLREDGRIALLVGDAQIGSRRIDARRQLERLGSARGLRVIAWASQPRPDFRGGAPRAEHLVLLGRHAPGRAGPSRERSAD
jgi:SAM-dependent methyltransferase